MRVAVMTVRLRIVRFVAVTMPAKIKRDDAMILVRFERTPVSIQFRSMAFVYPCTSTSGSLIRKLQACHQFLEARFGPDAVECRVVLDETYKHLTLIERPREPAKARFFIAKRKVDQ